MAYLISSMSLRSPLGYRLCLYRNLCSRRLGVCSVKGQVLVESVRIFKDFKVELKVVRVNMLVVMPQQFTLSAPRVMD